LTTITDVVGFVSLLGIATFLLWLSVYFNNLIYK
jgi:Mg/Co/Ni transporter MgtE